MVAADEPVVVADEPVVAADVHAPGADIADDAEGFPGGLRDPLVLTKYADHVVINVWNREVFIIFKLTYLLSICYY